MAKFVPTAVFHEVASYTYLAEAFRGEVDSMGREDAVSHPLTVVQVSHS